MFECFECLNSMSLTKMRDLHSLDIRTKVHNTHTPIHAHNISQPVTHLCDNLSQVTLCNLL